MLHGDAANFYKFDIKCFRCLFPESEYVDNVKVVQSIYDLQSSATEETESTKRVVIVVKGDPPEETTVHINDCVCDLQVVCMLQAKKKGDIHLDLKL